MGLSRNKVAVPEGAAGTPPFWSVSTKCKRSQHAKRDAYYKVSEAKMVSKMTLMLLVLTILFSIENERSWGRFSKLT